MLTILGRSGDVRRSGQDLQMLLRQLRIRNGEEGLLRFQLGSRIAKPEDLVRRSKGLGLGFLLTENQRRIEESATQYSNEEADQIDTPRANNGELGAWNQPS